PGHVASIKNTEEGDLRIEKFTEPGESLPCSFERIYFSRGSDHDIYRERKAMGAALVDQVLEELEEGFGKAVFTFIPNTAETGYLGMMDELNRRRREQLRKDLAKAVRDGASLEQLDELIDQPWPKGEKLAHKDERFRTFISGEKGRNEMVALGYDITYGQIKRADTLVALDDSIVRGTTLKESLIGILARLKPRKIVIVSTAPQIRYPDCYGIDMSELGKFLAFSATIDLLMKTDRGHIIADTYIACKEALETDECEKRNFVKEIYRPFTPEQISKEMAEQVSPSDPDWDKEVVLIFQRIGNLQDAMRGDGKEYGDWYFTGNYPTPGGFRIVNQAFVNFIEENEDQRPYDRWLSQVQMGGDEKS
ncbi:MAG: amidophosphoribosyltransferase, partial [Verrucomicrobiota bacterium]